MRRIAVTTAALALLAWTGSGASAARTSTSTPLTAVVVAACHPSDDVTDRFATFVGQMQSVKGTSRMAMHFTLLEKLETPTFDPVALSELRPWRRSKKGSTTFLYTQRVTALRDGGSYRMRVQFRWYGSDGKVFKTKTVRSGVCRQPAPLPNLEVTSITARPGLTAGTEAYTITVQNDGTGDAGGVGVALKVDGGTASNGQVPALPAGKTGTVTITGPACTGFVRAAVDPGGRIRETNETDNVLITACPA
jgi:CARDB protein